jgi:excisionase family DNA binding protein
MEQTAITSQPKFLLSVAETAKALGLSRKKLWEITAPRGDLPCIRVGRRVLYSPADVVAWIERQKLQQHQEGAQDV